MAGHFSTESSRHAASWQIRDFTESSVVVMAVGSAAGYREAKFQPCEEGRAPTCGTLGVALTEPGLIAQDRADAVTARTDCSSL